MATVLVEVAAFEDEFAFAGSAFEAEATTLADVFNIIRATADSFEATLATANFAATDVFFVVDAFGITAAPTVVPLPNTAVCLLAALCCVALRCKRQ